MILPFTQQLHFWNLIRKSHKYTKMCTQRSMRMPIKIPHVIVKANQQKKRNKLEDGKCSGKKDGKVNRLRGIPSVGSMVSNMVVELVSVRRTWNW